MSLPRLPVTRAIVQLLAQATGRPCGVGELPRVRVPSDGWKPASVPYTILDALPGEFGGPVWWDWHADAAWSYQVTSVGERADQAQWLADLVREAVVGRYADRWAHRLEVPGGRVVDRAWEYDAGGQTSVSANGAIVSYVQRFTVTVTSAA